MHSTGLPKTLKLTKECSLEQFTSLVQDVLLQAPYSHHLRDLRKFATRTSDPQFLKVFRAKVELFERQQRQLRPSCRLSATMYSFEKLLGRLLSSRVLLPTILAIAIAGTYVYNRPPDWQNANTSQSDDLNELLEYYGMRISKSADAIKTKSPEAATAITEPVKNDQFLEQLLRSLRNPKVQQLLRESVETQGSASSIGSDSDLQAEVKNPPAASPPVETSSVQANSASATATPIEGSRQ